MMGRAKTDLDVAVVGAGPAGSSTAIRLAKAGLKVGLFEQKVFPRHKVCGEFVSPECMSHFGELGLMPAITKTAGPSISETVFYARSGRSISVMSEWFGAGGNAIGISRAAMDMALLDAAQAAGVDVREGNSVKRVTNNESRVEIDLSNTDGLHSSIMASLVIDATGRSRAVARHFDKPAASTRATHVAFKAHLSGSAIVPGACEIFSYNGGYGGCNSVEGGVSNLCFIVSAEDARRCASDPNRIMREVLFGNKRAAAILGNAVPVTDWLAVPIDRYGRGSLAPTKNVICVGDAAAFIDPFTGSGILMALQSGKIAAKVIAAGLQQNAEFKTIAANYELDYAAAFDRRLRICSALRHASSLPWLADAIISVLGLSTGARRRLAQATRSGPSLPVNIDT